jgi:hypothetical protein
MTGVKITPKNQKLWDLHYDEIFKHEESIGMIDDGYQVFESKEDDYSMLLKTFDLVCEENRRLHEEIKRLKEYEAMYKGLG